MSYEIGKNCPSYIDKEGIITFSCETVAFNEIKIFRSTTAILRSCIILSSFLDWKSIGQYVETSDLYSEQCF